MEELNINIIDYGFSASNSSTNIFTAAARNFNPTGDKNALKGAMITILSGTGQGQTNIIDIIDPSASNTLVLKNNWTVDTTSFYRIYTYVNPINFNAASKELIKANFKVIKPLLDDYPSNGDALIGNYDDASVSFMHQLKVLRTSTDAYTGMITDIYNFRNYISTVISNEYYSQIVWKMFDPNQPKGVWDNTNSVYKIYPPPVPFCFTQGGYFDMEIEAGMKKNPKLAFADRTVKRFVTVKIGGEKNLALNEQFEGGTLTWLTKDALVPVRNMKDFDNWNEVDTATLNPHYRVDGAGTITTQNVIPDGIKTGLWFDFNNASQLSNFSTPAGGAGTFSLNAGRLVIQGNAGGTSLTPAAELILGTEGNNAFQFGDMSAMVDVRDDESGLFKDTNHPHPPDNVSWYSYGGDPARTYTNHQWVDHTDINSRKTYPLERYFTPSFFIKKDNTGSIDFRSEFRYNDPFDNTFTDCKPTDAAYTSDMIFSVHPTYLGDFYTSRYGATSQGAGNINNYKLNSVVYNFNSTNNYVRMAVHDATPSSTINYIANDTTCNFQNNTSQDLNGLNPFTIPSFGYVGFKRIAPAGYFYPDNVSPNTDSFSTGYLRIIAGKRDNGDGTFTNPSFISVSDTPPENCARFKKIRLYYKIGVRLNQENGNPSTTADHIFIPDTDKLKFTIDLTFSHNSNSETVSSGEKIINSFSETSGTMDFALANNFTDPHGNNDYQYQFTIVNTTSSQQELSNFLQATLAITRVELLYDTETAVVSNSDNQ